MLLQNLFIVVWGVPASQDPTFDGAVIAPFDDFVINYVVHKLGYAQLCFAVLVAMAYVGKNLSPVCEAAVEQRRMEMVSRSGGLGKLGGGGELSPADLFSAQLRAVLGHVMFIYHVLYVVVSSFLLPLQSFIFSLSPSLLLLYVVRLGTHTTFCYYFLQLRLLLLLLLRLLLLLIHSRYVYFSVMACSDIFYACFCFIFIVGEMDMSKDLINAILDNGMDLLSIFAMGMALVYMYTMITVWRFQDQFSFDPGTIPPYGALLTTLVAALDYGFRSAPVWYDDYGSRPHWTQTLGSAAFSLSYNILVVLMFSTVLSSIVIAAFTNLRAKETIVFTANANECFVCGHTRDELEGRGHDYGNHIGKEHSLWSYILFFAYLDGKDPSRQTAMEREIYSKVNNKNREGLRDPDVSFFPIKEKYKVLERNELD